MPELVKYPKTLYLVRNPLCLRSMGNRAISRDVKIAAINLYEHGQLSLTDILHCVGFSRRTFFRVLNL